VFEHAGAPNPPNEEAEEVFHSTGAVLGGRRTFEVGRKAKRPEISGVAGGRFSFPEFILTHAPPEGEENQEIRFLSGDIREAVATAAAATGGKNLLVVGASVVRQCLDE
jgi:dihydrofolate reductase